MSRESYQIVQLRWGRKLIREMDKCSECKERKCWYVNISIVNIVKFNNININRLSHPFLLLILLNNRKISVKL